MAKKKQSGSISKRMQRRAEQRRKKRLTQLIVAAFLILILALAGWAIANGFSDAPAAQVEALPAQVSVDQAYDLVQKGAFLLDVREQHEWDAFHAPQATLIPLGELPSRVDEVPQDREIVVICRSGNRSQQGRDILLQAGFENVTSVDGGMIDWRDAGYPIE